MRRIIIVVYFSVCVYLQMNDKARFRIKAILKQQLIHMCMFISRSCSLEGQGFRLDIRATDLVELDIGYVATKFFK
jgi:uncharacterized metal-binding protein